MHEPLGDTYTLATVSPNSGHTEDETLQVPKFLSRGIFQTLDAEVAS